VRPYSIIGAPFAVYVAESGTAFPALDDVPGVGWTLLGENGTRSQDEDGVTITHGQTVNDVRAAGSTGPIKALRSEEELTIAFNLMDLTLEAYSYVLNGVTVVDTPAGAGAVGTREIGLSRGFVVAEFALLVRGPSPYDEALTMQYEVPRAYDAASAAPQFTKGTPAILACEFRALEDLDATVETERFGRLIAADAPATP
jgi:hypothetical protein